MAASSPSEYPDGEPTEPTEPTDTGGRKDEGSLPKPKEPKMMSLLEEDMLLDLTYDELKAAFR